MNPQSASALSVELRGVSKTYRARGNAVNALDPTDLRIEPGEFVSVVGPSGCGKSTMLSLVAGLVSASSGAISIGDATVTGPVTDVGIVFQDAVLLEWRRSLSNVMLQVEMRKLDRQQYRARALELLELVGLAGFEDKYPHELSGGMRQRVSICRALVHDPSLLLMDEPFGALDALTRDQISLDLQRLWIDTRKTVIFITHSVAEAVFLSDRIIVMSPRPGRVVADIRVDLPRPRSLAIRETPEFGGRAREIYEILGSLGVIHDDRRSAAERPS